MSQEFSAALSLLLGRNTGIPLAAMLEFVEVATAHHKSAPISRDTVASFFDRFTHHRGPSLSSSSTSGSPSSTLLAPTEVEEFCIAIQPLTELSASEMVRAYVTSTYRQAFEKLVDAPSSMAGETAAAAVLTDDVRDFLSRATFSDGKSMISALPDGATTVMKAASTHSGNQIDFAGFCNVLTLLLVAKRLGRADLLDAVTLFRQQRRDAKRAAMERLSRAAGEGNATAGGGGGGGASLGSELRVASSPRRKHGLSPYAFDSWRQSQAAVTPNSTLAAAPTAAAGSTVATVAVLEDPIVASSQSSPAPPVSPVAGTTPPADSGSTNPQRISTTLAPVKPVPVFPAKQQQVPTATAAAAAAAFPSESTSRHSAAAHPSSHSSSGGGGAATPPSGNGAAQSPNASAAANAAAAAAAAARRRDSVVLAAHNASTSYDFSVHTQVIDEAFSLLDVSEGGSLSLDAIYDFCAAFPSPPAQNAVRRLFQLVDVNASNDIDREEFEQLCFLLQQKTNLTVTEMCQFYNKAMYRRLFELVDDELGDGNESVSREELRVLLEAISPMLGTNFSAADVFRLTKEYDTDSLNIEQFQTVIKHIIKGRSVSKVVVVLEEALRRRRLVKRQALEKFAPGSTTMKKPLPPPPAGPPPPKTCAQCTSHQCRIGALEEEVATLKTMLETVERQRDAAISQRNALQRAATIASWNGGTQWFDDIQRARDQHGMFADRSAEAVSTLSVALCRNASPDGNSSSATAASLQSTSHMLDAFGVVATEQRVLRALQSTTDATSFLQSSDRPAHVETTLQPKFSRLSELQRELHASLTNVVQPALTDLLHVMQKAMQTLGSIAERLHTNPHARSEDDECRQVIEGAAASVVAARMRARAAVAESCAEWQQQLRATLAQRDALSSIALFIAGATAATVTGTTGGSTSTARGSSPERASSPLQVLTPRGADQATPGGQRLARTRSLSMLSGPRSAPSGPLMSVSLAGFEAATCDLRVFFGCLVPHLLGTASDAEVAASVLNQLCFSEAGVATTDANALSAALDDVVQRLVRGQRALSLACSDSRILSILSALSSTSDALRDAILMAAQAATKRDKSVMVTLLTSSNVSGGGGGATESGGSFCDSGNLPSGRARSGSTRGRSLERSSASATAPVGGGGGTPLAHSTQAYMNDLAYGKEIANRSSSPRIRSRRERPADVRHAVDILLVDFLREWARKIPDNFDRADPATNVFHFGTRKVELSAVDAYITVKVGGGYLLFEEFCQKYAAMEIRRLYAQRERDGEYADQAQHLPHQGSSSTSQQRPHHHASSTASTAQTPRPLGSPQQAQLVRSGSATQNTPPSFGLSLPPRGAGRAFSPSPQQGSTPRSASASRGGATATTPRLRLAAGATTPRRLASAGTTATGTPRHRV